jgi:putative ABC transport system substrate-binding protein
MRGQGVHHLIAPECARDMITCHGEANLMLGRTNRRAFIAALGGAAAWPLVARGRQPLVPIIGWLSVLSPESAPAVPYFQRGLADLGYFEGQNITIEYRWARNHPELFPSLAADLVQANVSVIAAVSGAPSARAARAATTDIPIVFLMPGDPVQEGLVASLGRPGGNLTGVTVTNTVLIRKQIELLNELLPGDAPLAVISDPNIEAESMQSNVQVAEQALGRHVIVVNAGTENDFDAAFTTIALNKASGLIVPDRPLFISRHDQLAGLAARYRIATIYPPADLARSGGLMSYGASTLDTFRRAGQFVGRILQGAKPADMPVEQPTKIELKINLKTAKTLGLEMPTSILLRANEVIE